MTRPDLLALLLTMALLAGCAGPGDTATPPGDGDATTTTTPVGTNAGSDPNEGVGSADDAADDPARWYAFAFDREVTPASGGAGKIQSYSYTNTREEGGQETTVDVDVEVQGVSTQAVRVSKIDMASGSFEPTTISTQLEVTKLRHELTVVKDDTGERNAGDKSVVTVYVPTGDLPQSSTFLWYFVKMEWAAEDGSTGTWEYYVSPEMQAEQEGGRAVFAPFEEGESSGSWWGFELMSNTYGLSWFAPYVRGDQQFEEGTFNYGGYSQSIQKETFRVGGYSFDGWSIEFAAGDAGSSGSYMMKASEDLPMPFAFRFGSQGGGSSSLMSYEMTDLKLG